MTRGDADHQIPRIMALRISTFQQSRLLGLFQNKVFSSSASTMSNRDHPRTPQQSRPQGRQARTSSHPPAATQVVGRIQNGREVPVAARYQPFTRRGEQTPAAPTHASAVRTMATQAALGGWSCHHMSRDIVHSGGCLICFDWIRHRLQFAEDASSLEAEAVRTELYAHAHYAAEAALNARLERALDDYHSERDYADALGRKLDEAEAVIRELQSEMLQYTNPTTSAADGGIEMYHDNTADGSSVLETQSHAHYGVPMDTDVHVPHNQDEPRSLIQRMPLELRVSEPPQGVEVAPIEPVWTGGTSFFNGVRDVHMGREWQQRALRNDQLGIPIPLGTTDFPRERGPRESDPNSVQSVKNLMDRVYMLSRPNDIHFASTFINRIYELLRTGQSMEDLDSAYKYALDRWEELGPKVHQSKSNVMRRQGTIRPRPSKPAKAPTFRSPPSAWRAHIAQQPTQRPTGVRLTVQGFAHIADIYVHVQMHRLGPARIRSRTGAPHEEITTAKRMNGIRTTAWARAIVFILARGASYYEERATTLGLTVNPVRTNTPFEGQLYGDDFDIDEAINHLAGNGVPFEWASNNITQSFALSYLREWERRNHINASSSRLYRAFQERYPQGRPAVTFITSNMDENISVEQSHDQDNAIFIDEIDQLILDTLPDIDQSTEHPHDHTVDMYDDEDENIEDDNPDVSTQVDISPTPNPGYRRASSAPEGSRRVEEVEERYDDGFDPYGINSGEDMASEPPMDGPAGM